MKIDTPILIIFAIAIVLNLLMDMFDFQSFIFGMLATFLSYNWKEIFKFKPK